MLICVETPGWESHDAIARRARNGLRIWDTSRSSQAAAARLSSKVNSTQTRTYAQHVSSPDFPSHSFPFLSVPISHTHFYASAASLLHLACENCYMIPGLLSLQCRAQALHIARSYELNRLSAFFPSKKRARPNITCPHFAHATPGTVQGTMYIPRSKFRNGAKTSCQTSVSEKTRGPPRTHSSCQLANTHRLRVC